MTKDEISLLLYLECRAVDHSGRVDTIHMNAEDMKIAERWAMEGFIKFGRIAFVNLTKGCGGTHWCNLSDVAWRVAAAERKARAWRLWTKRTWETAEEIKND